MFALQGSLEDTVAYKELVGIGIARGKEIGKEIGEKRGKEIGIAKGKVETLEELRAEGIIPEELFQEWYKKYQARSAELLKK